jgi:hypothetical protein
LVERARARGLDLAGPDGLLRRVTKLVLEVALEGGSPAISATRGTTRSFPGAHQMRLGHLAADAKRWVMDEDGHQLVPSGPQLKPASPPCR